MAWCAHGVLKCGAVTQRESTRFAPGMSSVGIRPAPPFYWKSNLLSCTIMGKEVRMLKYDKEIRTIGRTTAGYLYFCDSKHPLAYEKSMVYLHRHVASLKLGRWLKPHEHVHHADGDRENNDPSNLIVTSNGNHRRIHCPKRKCERCGKETYNKRFCSTICSNISRRKVMRPTRIQLSREMSKNNWCALGRKYGVSDNAIRKWARNYGLI